MSNLTQSATRTILITGVSQGLGLALAEGFIALGHTVIGCARDSARIVELQNKHGTKHRFDVLDVSDDKAVAAWAKSAMQSHGTPDLLLNNAAIINQTVALWEVPAADFDRLIDINIKGVANILRHFIPQMCAAKRGVIVNFSSGWGRSTSPSVASYCASKWAIEGLTQALAQELPNGMAAIPLNPGIIDTRLLRAAFGDASSSYPDANEWAETAVPFLLKLNAKNNGQSLTVG